MGKKERMENRVFILDISTPSWGIRMTFPSCQKFKKAKFKIASFITVEHTFPSRKWDYSNFKIRPSIL